LDFGAIDEIGQGSLSGEIVRALMEDHFDLRTCVPGSREESVRSALAACESALLIAPCDYPMGILAGASLVLDEPDHFRA
jgi:hypothetical protein